MQPPQNLDCPQVQISTFTSYTGMIDKNQQLQCSLLPVNGRYSCNDMNKDSSAASLQRLQLYTGLANDG